MVTMVSIHLVNSGNESLDVFTKGDSCQMEDMQGKGILGGAGN